jgi:hypothetical protein
MTTQRFQTVLARARAHRVAILIDINDPYWETSCVGVIQFLTKLWGGSQAVIIPTDGKTIAEEFWAVLSVHDPDQILCYRTTGADLQIVNPEQFQSTVDKWTQEHLATSGMEESDLRHQMEEHLLQANLGNFGIFPELSQQIITRLAPIHYDKAHTQEHTRQLDLGRIARGSSPFYPLTSVLDVLPFADPVKTIAEIVRDGSPLAPPVLWIAASMGSNDAKQTEALKQANVASTTFHTGSLSAYQLVRLGIEPGDTLKVHTPWALPMTALSYYRSLKSLRYQLPTVVMIGDTISDFCMYYALRCLQGRALWLPKWFFEDSGPYSSRLATAVRGAAELGRAEHAQQLSLASFSLSAQEMSEAEARISPALHSLSSVKVEAMNVELVNSQLRSPFRSCTAGTIGDISTRMFVDGELPGVFETPRPLGINPLDAQKHRWMVDISFENYQLPRHPALASYVIADGNLLNARSGKDAVSYSCPGIFVMGTDVETNLVRPRLKMPNCEKIFQIVFGDCGYESQPSDKGVYAAQACDKFGGLEEIGYSLRTNDGLVLRKYLDHTEPPKGSHDDGTYLNDQRRYLNFQAIAKILNSDESAIRLIDSFVSKGIFYRGFIFACNRCGDVAWFSISEINETFTCRRCRTTQPYMKKSWRHPNEPAWFYKLDEIVYLTMKNNGDVPLLTLDYIRRQSKESFLFSPELRIRPEGSRKAFMEIDICCVSNGRICIGEAKSNDSIATNQATAQKVGERYRDLAVKIGASMVAFSTSATCWSEPTFTAISTAFETHPYIEILTLGNGGLFQI